MNAINTMLGTSTSAATIPSQTLEKAETQDKPLIETPRVPIPPTPSSRRTIKSCTSNTSLHEISIVTYAAANSLPSPAASNEDIKRTDGKFMDNQQVTPSTELVSVPPTPPPKKLTNHHHGKALPIPVMGLKSEDQSETLATPHEAIIDENVSSLPKPVKEEPKVKQPALIIPLQEKETIKTVADRDRRMLLTDLDQHLGVTVTAPLDEPIFTHTTSSYNFQDEKALKTDLLSFMDSAFNF